MVNIHSFKKFGNMYIYIHMYTYVTYVYVVLNDRWVYYRICYLQVDSTISCHYITYIHKYVPRFIIKNYVIINTVSKFLLINFVIRGRLFMLQKLRKQRNQTKYFFKYIFFIIALLCMIRFY